MSDRLAVMNQGLVEQVGTPEDIYLRPRTRFVAGFLGAVNWIGNAGVRPEAARVLRAPDADNARCCACAVTGTVFLGDCVQVLVHLASGEDVVAQLPRHAADFQPGESAYFTWNAADEMDLP